jgi:hypothetical protein
MSYNIIINNIFNIVQEFLNNNLNKTKTIALSTLKFWQLVCFIIIDMYAKNLCDHQNGF